MRFAIRKSTNSEVEASELAARGGTRAAFVCPVCTKPVRFRGGSYNVAHFAHKPNQASPECELYSGKQENGEREPRRYVAPLRPLGVYLTVGAEKGTRTQWSATLLIPRSLTTTGTVSIPQGLSGNIVVPCSILSSGKRVPIRIQSTPYQVTASSDVDAEFARKFRIPTAGFADAVMNAFRYMEGGGRRLSDNQPLYWGRGYYLVWADSLRVDWPKALWREELARNNQWRCARAELPPDADRNVEQWADTFLGRDIVVAPFALSIVAPATASRLDDETWVIPHGGSITVGILGEYGSEMPKTLWVLCGNIQKQIRLPVATNPICVTVTDLPLGFASVVADLADDSEELQLTLVAAKECRPVSGPSLVFDSGIDEIELPVHSEALPNLLQAVRKHVSELTSIDSDIAFAGTLKRRDARLGQWKEEAFVLPAAIDPADDIRDREELLHRLLLAIRSSGELQLDLHAFGNIRVVFDESPPIRPATRLPIAVRHRIRWLLSLPSAPGSSQSFGTNDVRGVLETCMTNAQYEKADKDLLVALARRTEWMPMVVPHVRDLLKSLSYRRTQNA